MFRKKWPALLAVVVLLLCLGGTSFGYLDGGRASDPAPPVEMASAAKTAAEEPEELPYDSYLFGGASAAAYRAEALDKYLGGRFCNLSAYGSDLRDAEQAAAWLLENTEVRRIVIALSADDLVRYGAEKPSDAAYGALRALERERLRPVIDRLSTRPGAPVLLTSPESAPLERDELYALLTAPQARPAADVEPISDLESYLAAHPDLADAGEGVTIPAEAAERLLKDLTDIRDLCAGKDAELLVIYGPVCAGYLDASAVDAAADFCARLAEITPFWDFSAGPVGDEPRYFLDQARFRGCVGDMILAGIAGSEDIYVPENFGAWVTTETAADRLASETAKTAETDYTAQVPVLMYHRVAGEGNTSTVISPALFAAHMAALAEAGYTAVFPDDLAAYVYHGTALPEKPVVITMDDGYLDNYTTAWPILQTYGMRATIFAIGATVGQTEHYKDTQWPITPHFSYEQAREMVDSGVIVVQSHTYDMHQWAPYEPGRARESILRWEDEAEDAYRALVAADCDAIRKALSEGTGQTSIHVMAFPGGYYDELSQELLLENGFDISFSTRHGTNTLVKGLPQSMLALHRYNMNESISVETLLDYVSDARG